MGSGSRVTGYQNTPLTKEACVLWGPTWLGKRILIWRDNQSVVAIIIGKHSKSPRIMDLVCSITLLTLINNFTISATHIPGVDNAIADSLSRFQMDLFWTLAPTASHTPCIIPSSAMLASVQQYFHASLAPSTRGTYQAGQKDFVTFNLMHGLVGPSNLLLPASEQACCCMKFVE